MGQDVSARRHYDESVLASGGDSVAAACWHSAESQQRRFEVLAQCGMGLDHSILDVGCGGGDLARFLTFPDEYLGIDVSPRMIDMARDKYPLATFEVLTPYGVPDQEWDWVLASGLFAFGFPSVLAVEDMIEQLWHIARVGVAFNMLSEWAFEGDAASQSWNPASVLRACYRHTPFLVLRMDYAPQDFTIYMYREKVT